jgi:hypothetical protein
MIIKPLVPFTFTQRFYEEYNTIFGVANLSLKEKTIYLYLLAKQI